MKWTLWIYLLGLALAVAAKPNCPALGAFSQTLAYCLQGCCNTRTYSGVRCSMNECDPALADPCWPMACVDGRFDRDKWHALQAEWKDEEWNAFVAKHHYVMRQGCDSHDLHCIPVPRRVPFAQRSAAPGTCCIPVCDRFHWEDDMSVLMDERLLHLCDFSEGGSVGYVHFSAERLLNVEK